MLPQFANVTLDAAQTASATQHLLRVAQVDGARTAEEVALIRDFYDACRNNAADWPPFSALQGEPPAAVSAATFPEAAQRDLVVASCLLLAYADGALTADELAAVQAVAAEVGMTVARVDELLALVKDTMLAQLARLPDAASVAAVARELG